MKKWLKENKPVDKEDLERHDKWLCMMYPRLKLLHELLADDGSLWVSIDDDEGHYLKVIIDEIFGRDNFISNVIWEKKYSPQNDAKWLSDNHDHILCYAKNKDIWRPNLLPRTEEMNARYKNPDNDPRGPWKLVTLHAKSGTNTESYTFRNGYIWTPPPGTFHRYSKNTMDSMLLEDKIWFGKNKDSIPSVKKFLSDVKDGVTSLTIWKYDEVGHNHEAKKDIKEVLNDKVFDTPKPVKLIQKILKLSTKENDIILDSFAGSGTTAHAVLDLNKEDGGNRKFILIECEDYADTITAERVRRVIKGIPNAKDPKLKAGLGGSFTYCELGAPISIENIIKGDSLPSYDTLARYIYYNVTGKSLDKNITLQNDFYIGETASQQIYLIYKPDIAFLRSNDSALNNEKLKQILERKSPKEKLIFATSKFMGQEELRDYNITFCQLPYAIHKVMGA